MRNVAIFDIDGTVFRSSLFIELIEALIDEGLFPVRARDEYRKQKLAWLDREAEYDAYIAMMVKTFHRHIKGVSYKRFSEVGERVVAEHKNRVYRYTRDLVRDLKRKHYFLLAISQSPKSVLEHFCKHLGFDKVYGRIYELGPGGKFTGEVTDMHLIANKATIARRALEKEGLTLAGSIGVGDTEDDLRFLELVENPIAFNPSKALYRHAKRNGWTVVVERKDVIYQIENR